MYVIGRGDNIFKGQNSSVYDLHIGLSLRFAFDHTSFTVYFKNLFVYDAFDSFPETTISPNRLCRLNGQAQIRIYWTNLKEITLYTGYKTVKSLHANEYIIT
jgi:hypothetical protein